MDPGSSTVEDAETVEVRRGPVRSAEAPPTPTPLPKLQLAIVLLLQLTEPIIGTVIYPFIAQLVGEVGVTHGNEKATGYYVGMIDCLFFFTEGLFVLQWGRLSDRFGRKLASLFGLLGVSLSILLFGLSKTFISLVLSRALAGVLNGNIGILKTMLAELTDESNQSSVLGIVPIVWSLGVTVGPLIGGTLEHPAEKFSVFRDVSFWKKYPYFLPCAVAAAVPLVGFIVATSLLKETLPASKRRQSAAKSSNAEESPLLSDTSSSHVEIPPETEKHTPALKDLLTRPVLIVLLNYAWLAIIEIAHFSLLPLFLAVPHSAGGLDMNPQQIGVILGGYGLLNGIFQLACFRRIHAWIGAKRIFLMGMFASGVIFAAYPAMHYVADLNGGKTNGVVWAILIAQNLCAIIMDMCFACIFIFTTSAASGIETLGATNGIAQTVASLARGLGPISATALFSLSIEKNLLGGYFVYLLFCVLSCLAVLCGTLLPRSESRFRGAQ